MPQQRQTQLKLLQDWMLAHYHGDCLACCLAQVKVADQTQYSSGGRGKRGELT